LSQQKVDAMVNAATSAAALASGASAFIWAWDRRQRKELQALSGNQGLAAGQAVAGSAGKLPARSVIHTVHPADASSDGDLALLASCYRESLAIAAGLGARSVGFAKMAWPDSDAAARSRAAIVAISEAMTAPAGPGRSRHFRITGPGHDPDVWRRVRQPVAVTRTRPKARPADRTSPQAVPAGTGPNAGKDTRCTYRPSKLLMTWPSLYATPGYPGHTYPCHPGSK
jgi:hypothetical protein